MQYQYGDHPTKKEIIIESPNAKKAMITWSALQKEWFAKANMTSLPSKDGKNFWYVITPHLLSLMTKISEHRGFLDALSLSLKMVEKLNEKAIDYEAYYSSHIEGAKSTLEEALRFIKTKKRRSKDESLQMIGNNRRSLEYALSQMGKPVTHKLVCRLQEMLTENTHRERPITRGEYRHGPVYIVNGYGEVVYEGPPHEKVHAMMNDLLEWLERDKTTDSLLKAGIAHLYFVHVHPFDDGNGRTARAVSNLTLANSGFKFINMLSLSSYFDHKRPSYYKAIQDVREHGYDLTYFMIFYMEALLAKLEETRKSIETERKIKNIREILSPDIAQRLNRRQVKALQIMIRQRELMTTRKYCKINKCSDETARKDILILINLKLVSPTGAGRSRGYELSE